MPEPDVRIQVRLSKTTAQSVEAAAKAEGIPISTWIRNQITASLYLAGVQSVPQVIYQGFRHSIQDVAENIEEISLAVRAWPELLQRVMATSMIAGGLDSAQSAERAEELVLDALKATLYEEPAEGKEDDY